MASELTGKVAIVTGGASGLGLATTEKFISEGATVVVADIDPTTGEAEALRLGDKVSFIKTDVSDSDQVQAAIDHAVDHFGGLDIVFNNAGVASAMTRFLHDDLRDFSRVMAVNVLGVMLGSQRAARYMKDHGGGSIVNCASIAGVNAGAGLVTYRASKAAVIHLTRSMAVDLAPYNIRVNCIAPGNIQTAMTTYDLDAVTKFTQPLPRLGHTTDVAEAVLYLASDRSAQITGVLLPIDGGTTAGPPVSQLKYVMPAPPERAS